jgi:hypothetical protein
MERLLESDALSDPHSVKRTEGVSDAFRPSNIEDQASSVVLHRLKTTGARGRKSVGDRIALIQSLQHQ